MSPTSLSRRLTVNGFFDVHFSKEDYGEDRELGAEKWINHPQESILPSYLFDFVYNSSLGGANFWKTCPL